MRDKELNSTLYFYNMSMTTDLVDSMVTMPSMGSGSTSMVK